MKRTLFVIAGFTCLLDVACRKSDEEESADTSVPVRTVLVTTSPVTQTVGAFGSITARSGHIAALSAPTAARIVRVLVSVGDRVRIGQPLVELDQAPIRAAAQSAATALRAAQQAHARAQRLAREGIIPRKEVEQAAADLAKARADAVAASRAAQLSVIRSPINGVVTQLQAVLGATADPAQALVEVADPSATDIVLNVTPSAAGQIQTGAKVRLSSGEGANSEALGIGTVVDLSATVDSATRSVGVRVRAPATRRPLRLGETIFGQIEVATHPMAITVPVAALVPVGDGFQVFVVDTASLAHARPVTVGTRTQTQAEITRGLSAGERVVTEGAYGLEDGVKVVQQK
jgi:membrane fusion protein, multidrug efflux system